jgi:aminopeptidase
MAEVIVRVGLNLQAGQSLLITDPYDLHGVHPESIALIDAVRAAAPGDTSVILGNPEALRAMYVADDLAAFEDLVSSNLRQMKKHLADGGAFLFMPGSNPQLLAGLPSERISRFDAVKWKHLGPLIRALLTGATQWTLVPAPCQAWADVTFGDLNQEERLPALWSTLGRALRIEAHDAQTGDESVVDAWKLHLARLSQRRDELNRASHKRIRYVGPGTELTLELPRFHCWCTAQLVTRRGIPFVVNLPTEEIFTAPKRCSASGRVRVTRPVTHAGVVIAGIELEFHRGRVRTASSATNADLLHRVLSTDDGADRVGEVAIIPRGDALPWGEASLHHALLDENATPHIALGDAYRFCNRAWLPLAINSSQIHIDLPLEARVELL